MINMDCVFAEEALSALAGAGGIVTVLIEDMDSKRLKCVEMEFISEDEMIMPIVIVMVYPQANKVADAQPRKAWQTCYGPAKRNGKRDKHDFGAIARRARY
jgi:hypothetical protein